MPVEPDLQLLSTLFVEDNYSLLFIRVSTFITRFGIWQAEVKVNTENRKKHRRSQGGQGGHTLPKFQAYFVVLCFERPCPKN